MDKRKLIEVKNLLKSKRKSKMSLKEAQIQNINQE